MDEQNERLIQGARVNKSVDIQDYQTASPKFDPRHNGPSRLNARHYIEERIVRLHREAGRLEALLKALPMELPIDADEALFNILTTIQRY